MFKLIIFALVGFLIFSLGCGRGYPDPSTDEFIDQINLIQDQWISYRNYSKDMPMYYMKQLSSTPKGMSTLSMYSPPPSEDVLPETFDAREHWPNCPSIGRIRNQGRCGSCWAYTAVQVMTDRYCIHSNSTKNFRFSVEYVISCCTTCGSGCKGGFAELVWDHWLHNGIVSGGPFESNLGCMPYTINSCQNKVNGVLQCEDVETPSCTRKCREGYDLSYENDFHRGKSAYLMTNDVEQIKREIYTNGPVQGVFILYNDFKTYKSGVYKFTAGEQIGYHSVKIIGWGVENNNIPYWLAANSWGSKWGTDGYFKILRGNNECEIEGGIFAGIPIISD